MYVTWQYKLKDTQRSNPVVYNTDIVLPTIIPIPSDKDLSLIFKTDSFSLQT